MRLSRVTGPLNWNEIGDGETESRTNDKNLGIGCAGPADASRGGFPAHLCPTLGAPRFSLNQPHLKEITGSYSGLRTRSMLGKNVNSPTREGTVSSIQSDETAGNNDDSKPSRKRKRKGLGNWTRTTLACVRCRKMKIRVFQ
jgi:hypothetical protein